LKKFILFVAAVGLAAIWFSGCGMPSIKAAANALDQFDLAKAEYDEEHWLKAIEGFQKVIFNFPGATIVDTAQYYLAMSYYNNDEYELAAVEFQRLITNYPRSAYTTEAQFMAAMCYMENTPDHYALDQEDLKSAIALLRDFIIDNPDSPLVESARAVIGEGMDKLARKEYETASFYLRIYDLEAARIYFQHIIDNYTDTRYAPRALFGLSEVLYKESRMVEALEKFNHFLVIYPGSELVSKAEEYIKKINLQLESVNASDDS